MSLLGVEIAEPSTVLTDYLLALVAFAWGGLLLREKPMPARLFGIALLATGCAATVGGTYHGFRPGWSEELRAAAWTLTYVMVGIGNLLLLAGAILAWAPRPYRMPLLGLAGFRLGVFVILLASHRDFRHVVYDVAGTLAGLTLLALLGRALQPVPVPMTLAAVGVTLAGGLLNQAGLRLHEHFNHNDVFHVVQVGALWCFYRAAKRFA